MHYVKNTLCPPPLKSLFLYVFGRTSTRSSRSFWTPSHRLIRAAPTISRSPIFWLGMQPRDARGLTKATVQRYARQLQERGLAAATVNVRLTAVRRLAAEAADNGLLAPDLAAGISRVKGIKQQGTRTGNWLTVDQAELLINAPDTTKLKGKRDRALLAVLIGCGLRRSEVSELRLDQVQQRDSRWAIVDMHGKGNRMRTVPMPSWTKAAVDLWVDAAASAVGASSAR